MCLVCVLSVCVCVLSLCVCTCVCVYVVVCSVCVACVSVCVCVCSVCSEYIFFTDISPLQEKQLLSMVGSVSEDKVNHTIEFNEFLVLMNKHQGGGVEREDLVEAFRFTAGQMIRKNSKDIFQNL